MRPINSGRTEIIIQFWRAAALVLMLGLAIAGQESPRMVDLGRQFPNQPLEILSCSVGKVVFPGCRDVRGEKDWWTQLTFEVKNVSKKTISTLTASIFVEKQGEMRTPFVMNVLARVPVRMIADERGWPSGQYGIRIEPGEVFRMMVLEGETKNWKRHLDRYNVADLSGFKFDWGSVYFDDGTTWFYGTESLMEAGQREDPTQKIIRARKYEAKDRPVEIVGLRADGQKVELGVPFKGGDEWLRDLTVRFRNISGRTILAVEFHLTFLASFPTGPNRADSLTYGLSPNQPLWDMSKARLLKPDAEDEVTMEAAQYKRLRSFLGHQEAIETRTTAEVGVRFVLFGDQTRWQYGGYYKPDPKKPGEFIKEK